MAGKETFDWDLGKAPKQSITEVLQDPRGPSIELPDISSIDLGTSTLSLTPVTPSNLPSALNINHFETYLRRYGPLYANYRSNVQQSRIPSVPSLPASSSAFPQASHTGDASVPSNFFDPLFDVAAYPPLEDLQHKPDEPLAEHPDLPLVRDELITHQRNLEHQLTSVLHTQSGQIDAALQNMRSLRETLLETASKLRQTRSQAAALVPQVTAPIACICALTTAQENVDALLDAAIDLQTAIAAPNDVKVLLEAGAYAAAIDRVTVARAILGTSHLTGVHALFPIRHQLANAIETIDTALRREFRSALHDADEDALDEVVALVHRIGRVSLLGRFFTKEITDGLSAQLSETTGLPAVARVVHTAAERAAILSRIVYNYRFTSTSKSKDDLMEISNDSRDFSGTDEESRREMLLAFEELLATYVDTLWPSFETRDGDSTNTSSYIVLTKDTSLGEETCFDEFKAALKFGEEVRLVEEIATDIETQFDIAKKASPLRAKISERLISFVSAFHRTHVDAITSAVRTDKWQEVSVPVGAVRLLDAIASDRTGDIVKSSPGSSSKTAGKDPVSVLVLDGEIYRTVASGVRYVRSACAYALLAEQSATLGAEVSRRGTELSRVFNTLVWKAILGVAAIQWSGLRSITARHLSLASRTITLAAFVAKRVHIIMESVLESSSNAVVVVPLMRKAEKDLQDHHSQLISKIVDIMLDRLHAHEEALKALPWEKQQELMRFDVPSGYISTLSKETAVLHRILWHVLPQSEAIVIFRKVWTAYGTALSEAYGSLDGGREWIRERVARDVGYLHDSFLKLELSRASPEAFKPIAQLYKRFAKEFLEDTATEEVKDIPTISELDSRSSVVGHSGPKTVKQGAQPTGIQQNVIEEGKQGSTKITADNSSSNLDEGPQPEGQISAANGNASITPVTTQNETVPTQPKPSHTEPSSNEQKVQAVSNTDMMSQNGPERELNGVVDKVSQNDGDVVLDADKGSPAQDSSQLKSSKLVDAGSGEEKFDNHSPQEVDESWKQDNERTSGQEAIHSPKLSDKNPEGSAGLNNDNESIVYESAIVDVDQARENTELSEELT